jgi:hypothetical protein
MIRILKPIATLFVGLIVQFFLTTLLFILTDLPYLLDILLALPGAWLAARSTWQSASGETIGMGFSVLTGALIVGGVGFIVGFIGPMMMPSEASQGPMLGVLITGPVGLVIGAIAGLVYAIRHRAPRHKIVPPVE